MVVLSQFHPLYEQLTSGKIYLYKTLLDKGIYITDSYCDAYERNRGVKIALIWYLYAPIFPNHDKLFPTWAGQFSLQKSGVMRPNALPVFFYPAKFIANVIEILRKFLTR